MKVIETLAGMLIGAAAAAKIVNTGCDAVIKAAEYVQTDEGKEIVDEVAGRLLRRRAPTWASLVAESPRALRVAANFIREAREDSDGSE